MWMKTLDICDQCDVTELFNLLSRTSLGDSFWTRYDFIHITIYWLTTRIRARNSRNTSNAPSWYMLRLITLSAGSISHFIWTLKTQPLFLSLASPTSPWSAFEWGSQWYVFSSRYCTSYGVYQIEGNSFRTYDARDKTFFESEGSWTSKRYFGSKLCKLFGLWLLTTRHV